MIFRKVAKDKTKPVGERELAHVALELSLPVEKFAVSAFNEGFLDIGVGEGWIETPNPRDPRVGDLVVFKTVPPATYRVTAERGRYCDFCDEKLEDDDFSNTAGAKAREHVAEFHAGESLGEESPAGYRCDNFVVAERV